MEEPKREQTINFIINYFRNSNFKVTRDDYPEKSYTMIYIHLWEGSGFIVNNDNIEYIIDYYDSPFKYEDLGFDDINDNVLRDIFRNWVNGYNKDPSNTKKYIY